MSLSEQDNNTKIAATEPVARKKLDRIYRRAEMVGEQRGGTVKNTSVSRVCHLQILQIRAIKRKRSGLDRFRPQAGQISAIVNADNEAFHFDFP